ncbi:RNA polymerase sigma factor [Permianibacter aggregans]|uniref:RNA polymerase sigma-70 factor (ECF subfamily) n=1 Tax=Permianibacter aggregans TaxID=1510150 RepID=A0A4R6USD8_9GAMM|nr:RNA polymerase sigma factor [Permianibacter aggregans]QGX38381.1 RNA polymerase sigma factor [Permianibacter aggregans]TDQ48709.1 RNA polymerase sigma-70 factor (ECF subfamily) [Permianibacter aggregans]
MQQAEEDLLVMAAQQGNEAAFNYLFRHYLQPLRRFAYKLGADNDSAQDAVQEAWILMAKSLHKMQDVRAFRSWLFRAVRWKVLERHKSASLPTVPLDDHMHDESMAVDANLDGDGSQNFLHRCMQQLPAIDQQALYLFYLQEMQITEIAIALDVPAGTIKSRLHRARMQLKCLMNDNEE